jgi:NADPH:quinone reductase-like Zn-dependent oxidoreductase/nucleoside-diphosphate-sugar epimerase
MNEAGISTVEKLSIHQPLKVEENSTCSVQVVVENGAIDVFTNQGGEWVRHVQAVVGKPAARPVPEEDLRDIQERLGPPQSIGDFYERMRQIGIAYGASYQRLKGFSMAGGSEALSQMEGGSDFAAIVDNALHVLFPLVERAGVKGLLLPVGIDRVWLSGSFEGVLWTHAKLTSLTPVGITADLEIYNERGDVVGRLESFQARRVGRQDVSLLHQLAWSESPPSTEPRAGNGDWLVIEDKPAQGQRLADCLRRRGCGVVLASRADGTNFIAQGRQWSAVVYLSGADPKQDVAVEQTIESSTGFLFPLVRSLRDSGQTPQLWVVTNNGQAVDGGSIDPVQATLWGAGRCLLLEYPEYRCSLIDRDSSTDEETLARELLASDGEALIGFRRDNRYVSRLKHWRGVTGDAQKLTIDAPGILDHLRSAVVERRNPGRDEVEIRVLATGLNFRDVLSALGMIPLQTPESASFGAECAGVVERVGEDVADIAPGDEVVAFIGSSFATHVIANAAMVARKADTLSFAQAAALPVAYMTCMYGMEMLAQMKKGDTVLVHAAAGGVGVAALELARRTGAVVLATAGSDHKRQYVRDQGVEYVFDSRSLDFADQVLEATNGRGVDIVVNSLAGDMIDASFRALAKGGSFIELGKRGIWTEAEAQAKRPDAKYFAFDFGERAWSNPSLVRELLNELNRRLESGELRPLPTQVFPFERAADAFRTMAQARHIGKLAVVQSGFGVARASKVHENGTYLITGGLGALGLQTATWLAQKGAKSLVLLGRRSPGPDAAEVIDTLRKGGVRVEVRHADVADSSAVEALFTDIRTSMEPVRGIFHAAGVVDDTIAADLTWDRAWSVMAPKIAGARNLDKASRRDPIDFFVLFSSASAVMGSPGQSSYAAGNAYLDAMANARRAEGLPALSINWGGWASSGMAAKLDSRQLARWERSGVTPIAPEDAFHALELALNGTAPQLTAINVDWDAFVEAAQLRRDLPFFADLPRKRSTKATTEVDLQTSLRAASAGERATLVKEFLRFQARQVLALPATYPFSDDQPLHELGLDSVMAVELRTRIDRGTGVSLPTVRLLDAATVAGLTPEILSKLEVQPSTSEPEARDSIEDLVDAIPDEDVDSMLKQLLAGAGGL